MRRISSSATAFYQFIIAPVWIVGFGAGAVFVLTNPSAESDHIKAVFPIAWVVGTLICLTLFRYATIDVSDSHLQIKRFWQTDLVPLTDVSGLGGSRLLSPETVTIHFELPNRFGRSISFLPEQRLFPMFRSHPIRDELQRMVDRAKVGAT